MELAKKPPPAPIVDQITASGRPIYFAILWHQHQPRYERDPVSGEYLDPWVRLHCAKDYYDMAAMALEFERLNYSINLTPVLLSQIEDIIQGYETKGPTDKMLRLSMTPASELTQDDKLFVLQRSFDASWSNQIDPFPRYRELRERRAGFSDEKLLQIISQYSTQDFLDLQVWLNLVWMDPDFLKGPVELPSGVKIDLSDLIKKGQGFTEAEKKRLLDAQIEIMRNVIPIHRKLQDEGKIEVTTTPFYHPILPLICDTDLARVAMPNATLPSERFSFPEDASAQVRRASVFYDERFHRKPEGMWPGEGAVAQEIIDIVASNGFKWMATDVENLALSLGKTNLTDDEKFSIYRGTQNGVSLGLVFRDTGLSNDIGFKFARLDPVEAANEFIKNLSNIQRELADSAKDHIVVVILDGDNPWQNYQNDGKDFLRALYSQLVKAQWVRTTTVGEFFKTYPCESLPTIEKLWPGSWDGHSFGTWIGEPEANMAWDGLTLARREFEEWKKGGAGEASGSGSAIGAGESGEAGEGSGAGSGGSGKAPVGGVKIPDEHLKARVYELLLAAEGSDWFWWYGKDKDSGNDERFDEAFRNTLKQAYVLMGKEPPKYLSEPIIGASAKAAALFPGGKEKQPFSTDDPPLDDRGPGI
jgi:alpha-amylase/alpha-mannosidase (GH57 family)